MLYLSTPLPPLGVGYKLALAKCCCTKSLILQSFELVQVTKLDRDPASGTALQEISFWLNLERALLRIQDIRESPDIALTLDILKHGKRFHATVSFDTDTGDFLL